MYTAVH